MPEEGTKDVTAPPAETEKVYKQADVDSITEKVRLGFEKKLMAAAAESEKLKASLLSEDEKKLAAAKAEGAAEMTKQLAEHTRTSAVREELLARGISKDQVAAMSRLVDPEIENVTAAVDAVAKTYAPLFNAKRSVGADGRNTQNPNSALGGLTDCSPDAIEKQLSGMTWQEQNAWWRKYGPAVIAEQKKGSAIQTFAPGEPMV